MGRKDDLLQLKRIILSELETLDEEVLNLQADREKLEDRLGRCEEELEEY